MELKGERIISFLKEKDIQEIKEVNIFKVRTSEEVLLFIIDVLT